MDAKAMSKSIRDRKKKMQESAGDVDLSGIPEDATDLEVAQRSVHTEGLDENHPAMHSEAPADESANERSMRRKARIKSYMTPKAA